MEATIKAIATVLRSTETMAEQFVERVQDRLDQPASLLEVLAVMQKIPAKSLSMEKVIAKVEQEQSRKSRTRRKKTVVKQSTTAFPAAPSKASRAVIPVSKDKSPKTLAEKLGTVLQENWDRAQAEGFAPDRMSPDAFIKAVYRYTDRRQAPRRLILQAAEQLDQVDVLLQPTLVADKVRELFERD